MRLKANQPCNGLCVPVVAGTKGGDQKCPEEMEPDQQGKALEPEEVVVEAEAEVAVLEQAPADTVYVQNAEKELPIS